MYLQKMKNKERNLGEKIQYQVNRTSQKALYIKDFHEYLLKLTMSLMSEQSQIVLFFM